MATIDKGEQIMNGLLLSQYKDSPLLKQYYMSFIGEMDYLFQNIEEVYLGRLINDAIGAQLDIIGEILQQSRNIDVETIYFGFQGVSVVGGFEGATPEGIFQSLNQTGVSGVPLDDITYRRVLLCKANLLNRDDISIEAIYESVSILLNRVPQQAVVTEPANLQVTLTLLNADIRNDEYLLILYMSKYFVPSNATFQISLI